MPVYIDDIVSMVNQHNHWREKETINLIASENVYSPAVRNIQNSDLMGRYAEGHPNIPGEQRRYYQGTKFVDQLENMARAELGKLLGTEHVDVRGISGNSVNLGLALTLLRGGDTVLAHTLNDGGHLSHSNIGAVGRRIQLRDMMLKPGTKNSVNLYSLPTTEDGWHTDAEKTIELVDKLSPQVVLLGKSVFLFPEPVKEISSICQRKNIPIWYDAAHVLGLIVGGSFQNPLVEGATFLTASTHKTFPGPQRGIIACSSQVENADTWWEIAQKGVFPALPYSRPGWTWYRIEN